MGLTGDPALMGEIAAGVFAGALLLFYFGVFSGSNYLANDQYRDSPVYRASTGTGKGKSRGRGKNRGKKGKNTKKKR
jgi:hypothetical protein